MTIIIVLVLIILSGGIWFLRKKEASETDLSKLGEAQTPASSASQIHGVAVGAGGGAVTQVIQKSEQQKGPKNEQQKI